MIRFLWIPIVGTIAALIAIELSNDKDPDAPEPPRRRAVPRDPALDRPEPPRPDETDDADDDAGVRRPAIDRGPGQEYFVVLTADGDFVDTVTEKRYADAKALLDALAPADAARPRIILRNATPVVSEGAVDEAAETLRERADVRTAYRGEDDEPPAENDGGAAGG